MKIIHVSSESNPFIKVGGLGDVVYSLCRKLVNKRDDVRIILPMYKNMKGLDFKSLKKVGNASVYLAWRNQGFDIFEGVVNGIIFYFIQNDYYFTHRQNTYGYFDDGERFAFFTLAAKTLIETLNLNPDIVHIHDWQVGMLPVIVREQNPINKNFVNAKFIMTIHNPAFQGRYGRPILGDLYNLSDDLFYSGKVRFSGDVSTLKSGIEYADMITTVSPTHAFELTTPEGSWGFDGILSGKGNAFKGILNGIDYDEWNPRKDKLIHRKYGGPDVVVGKRKNKDLLFKEFGLKNNQKPFFVVVSRLTYQKGVDLIIDAMEQLLTRGYPCFVLGSGEWDYENKLNELHRQYPNLMGVYIGYSDQLAHRLYASSDFFLMPSLFEPCGIGQLIAERYGSLPIVRKTGGLVDSVINYNGNNLDQANGYTFYDNNTDSFMGAINWALEQFKKNHDSVHLKLMNNALRTVNSWSKSAKEYQDLYKKLLK